MSGHVQFNEHTVARTGCSHLRKITLVTRNPLAFAFYLHHSVVKTANDNTTAHYMANSFLGKSAGAQTWKNDHKRGEHTACRKYERFRYLLLKHINALCHLSIGNKYRLLQKHKNRGATIEEQYI